MIEKFVLKVTFSESLIFFKTKLYVSFFRILIKGKITNLTTYNNVPFHLFVLTIVTIYLRVPKLRVSSDQNDGQFLMYNFVSCINSPRSLSTSIIRLGFSVMYIT